MHRDRPTVWTQTVWPQEGSVSGLASKQPAPELPLMAQRLPSSRTAVRSLAPGQVRQGSLSFSDPFNSSRPKRFADNYLIKNIRTDQQVRLKATSSEFDPFIQLVNAQTDEVILSNDDNGRNRNSQLSFVVQPGVTYQLRVSSYARRETGAYTLKLRALKSTIQNFSFAYGYGLVDAEAAVTAALALEDANADSGLSGSQEDIIHSVVSDVAEVQSSDDTSPTRTLWNLKRVKAPQVWQQGIRGEGVVVAVVDSGVSVHHPDIRTNLWRNLDEIPDNGLDDDGNGFVDDVRGWDFIKDDNNPRDGERHGTHVAGIVGAHGDRVTGVAPESTIMPVRVLDRNGSGTSKGVAKGIRYAVKNGADVINLSLGAPPGGRPSRSIRRALRFAHRQGVVVAIAAGNERDRLGTSQPGEPAFWAATRNLAIAVGAVNRRGEVADFSNPTGNRKVNSFVVAPGVEVGSLAAVWLRNAFGPNSLDLLEPLPLSGTSMATPHVAGVAALMLNANPNLTPKQVNQILSNTANPENLTPL